MKDAIQKLQDYYDSIIYVQTEIERSPCKKLKMCINEALVQVARNPESLRYIVKHQRVLIK